MIRFCFVSLAAILAGCSEVNLSNLAEGNDGIAPKIEVTPNFLDYGMVEDGAEVVRTFTVKNVGGAPLTVDDVTLDAPASYTILTDVTAVVLDPESTIVVTVDGQQWVTGWHYDAATNAIVFDEELPEGAHIEVEYGALICE